MSATDVALAAVEQDERQVESLTADLDEDERKVESLAADVEADECKVELAADLDADELLGVKEPVEDIEALEKHRDACVREGKFEEAAELKERLAAMREQVEIQRREALRAQHLVERQEAEEAHAKEVQAFHEFWDQKVADFDAHAASQKSALEERQKMEHEAHLAKLHKETEPRAPRFSKELLNLRKVQDAQAKQKSFAEAAVTKHKADAMEAAEEQSWREKREAKISGAEEKFIQKQALEMAGLQKRLELLRKEQEHARQKELTRVTHRSQNVMSHLLTSQKIVQKKVELYPLVHAPSTVGGAPLSTPSSLLASPRVRNFLGA